MAPAGLAGNDVNAIEQRRALGLILLPVDVLVACCILIAAFMAGPFVRLAWALRRTSGSTPRVLTLAYTTLQQATEKGLITSDESYEEWYNPGGQLERVVVAVLFGRTNTKQKLDARISYIERTRQGNRAFRVSRFILFHVGVVVLALKLITRERLNVLQVNGLFYPAVQAVFIKALTGLPALVFIEAFWEDVLPLQPNMTPRKVRLMLLWARLTYRLFDIYVGAPSFYPDRYVALGMKRSAIRPYVHNIDAGKVVAAAAAADVPADILNLPRPWILTVGRLAPEKLPLDAVRLRHALDQSRVGGTLLMIGDGPLRDEVLQAIQSLGVRDGICVAGFRPQAVTWAIMARSDYFFAPLQGNAMIEAMALGACIVAYDNVAHRIFVKPGRTGIFVPQGDVQAAARVIRDLQDSPERAQQFRSAAQAHALTTYNIDTYSEAWVSPFRQLVLRDPQEASA